jgi:hypothetical protein
MTVGDIRTGIKNLPHGLEQLSQAYDDQSPGSSDKTVATLTWRKN